MADITWTSPAFLALEALPDKIAFRIFGQVEMLRNFPQMGGPLPSERKAYARYRQLLYREAHRIIYEYDEIEDTVYVTSVQNCKQKLPSPRELKRQLPLDE